MTLKTVQLRYFAAIREAIGHGSEAFATDASTVAELRDALLARGEPYASCLARGRVLRIAVNQALSDESAALEAGAEVAFFPPVTGG
ncbi:molybdopterin converting factor subunit 1 [Comamonas sp. JUb58]|uniref:molybdopterin converting factor subunit 1 n=1 Tax=Comamonas sp. JUb58 TaxID=2485114 RepID=UPI001061A504|nr:molybdopterin converting factor subunit 1 [Comamonas sp. JUb58]TDS84083.1 molybdopterin synthase subunit MoaD [Comamonas sp. JUb58]